jgi:hypothetical protein
MQYNLCSSYQFLKSYIKIGRDQAWVIQKTPGLHAIIEYRTGMSMQLMVVIFHKETGVNSLLWFGKSDCGMKSSRSPI